MRPNQDDGELRITDKLSQKDRRQDPDRHGQERRHSDGKGLLHADGASRANILSGDATYSMLTMSTVLTRRRPIGRDYAAYFARPYATFKTLNAVVAEYFR